MRLDTDHGWDLSTAQAIALQQRLRSDVITRDVLGRVRYVAGVGGGVEAGNTLCRAAVVVLDIETLRPCAVAVARRPVTFPYVPGLLSFREIPAVRDALSQLEITPDLLLCDGQGIAHPRRFGIACHLGVLTGLPSIGVAKKRLIGTHEPLGNHRGDRQALMDKGECIGAVLRTRAGVKPLYVSIGHKVGLETAIDYVMRCTTRYRLPETTRWAHKIASGKGDVPAWRGHDCKEHNSRE